MKRNDDRLDLPGWRTIAPPPGGLERVRLAMQQSGSSEPSLWMAGLGGALSAIALVAVLSFAADMRQQSDAVQHLVLQARAYQQAASTFVPIAGDEDSPVRVYVAMPMDVVRTDTP